MTKPTDEQIAHAEAGKGPDHTLTVELTPEQQAGPQPKRFDDLAKQPKVYDQIAGQFGDEIDAAMVQSILETANTIQDGDSLRTIRKDDAGLFYIRVIGDDGFHYWRIVDPINGFANSFSAEPKLSYPIIYQESEQEK